ncbi:MAG: DNA primase [Clostridia bacterium]|nr:DNA primase [Clostridia bacterium]
MIDTNTIQNILETARIDEVVGDFVTLKKRGANLLGLCPFHNEKTPSFTVSPRLGIYKCFGCGKGGNAVNFVMEHEHFSYPEALKYLARKYNIEIQEEEQTPEQVQALNEQESLYHVSDFAARYFADNLYNHGQGRAIGLTYFKERGFRDDIIKKFMLGYAIDEWTNFTDHAIANGYDKKYLESTGLTIVKEDKMYDRFRGRVIFPIQNISGRVLGFGGRTLSVDKKTPKYVNSPESEIYHKSNVLYGINHARTAIIGSDNCFLVEGYTDVISLHQAGIINVVASSGTSLTTEQIKLIKRYTRNITILFDGDSAGIKAAFRGIDMVLEEGLDVKIVLFPEGDDPDSFARKHRSSEVEDFLHKNAVNFIFFKTRLLLDETNGDPLKKAALIGEIVQSIALIPDKIVQSLYLKECSAILHMEETTLMNELNKIRRRNYDRKIKEQAAVAPEKVLVPPKPEPTESTEFDFFSTEYQEKDIIRLLMRYPQHVLTFEVKTDKEVQTYEFPVASYIVNDLRRDELHFRNPIFQKVFDTAAAAIDADTIPDETFFLYNPDKEISALAATMLTSRYELNDWSRVKIVVKNEADRLPMAVTHALLSMKLRVLEKKFDEMLASLKQAPDSEIMPLMSQQRKLQQKIERIAQELQRIVLR